MYWHVYFYTYWSNICLNIMIRGLIALLRGPADAVVELHIYIYIYTHTYRERYVCIYIYIYIYTPTCVYIYIYMVLDKWFPLRTTPAANRRCRRAAARPITITLTITITITITITWLENKLPGNRLPRILPTDWTRESSSKQSTGTKYKSHRVPWICVLSSLCFTDYYYYYTMYYYYYNYHHYYYCYYQYYY